MIYLIGSLRNPEVPTIANQLRAEGFEVFDDWFAAGPEADDKWRDYEQQRGHTFQQALDGHAAQNVFKFDKQHLERAETVLLVLPAGKSGHLELGWALGRGKKGYILLNDPDRWDVMYQFADQVVASVDELLVELRADKAFTELAVPTVKLKVDAEELNPITLSMLRGSPVVTEDEIKMARELLDSALKGGFGK